MMLMWPTVKMSLTPLVYSNKNILFSMGSILNVISLSLMKHLRYNFLSSTHLELRVFVI